jgi:methionyl-tRNA formyltransferase
MRTRVRADTSSDGVSRLVFLGSPEAAVPSLRALVAAGHDVVLVVSRPDRRRGRGSALSPSAVKRAASELGLATADDLDEVLGPRASAAELGVVVAYGRIVPRRVLDAMAMVNVHFSLLPRWRGAAPVERAILAGDDETGVCLMRLEEGLDTGPILARRRTRIDHASGESAAELTARLAATGAEMLVESLAGGVGSLPAGDPQRGEPTYAAKVEPDELRIDWSDDAASLDRLVRLGRAWTTFRGQRLRVLRARPGPSAEPDVAPGELVGLTVGTGSGGLVLAIVQPEGRRPMDAEEWSRGARPAAGERLGEPETASEVDGPEGARR